MRLLYPPMRTTLYNDTGRGARCAVRFIVSEASACRVNWAWKHVRRGDGEDGRDGGEPEEVGDEGAPSGGGQAEGAGDHVLGGCFTRI
jgi:hypothetical protein